MSEVITKTIGDLMGFDLGSLLFRNTGGISKMKVGGILGTIGGILTTVGGMLTGNIALEAGILALMPLLGILVGVAGWRDAISSVKPKDAVKK